MRRLPIIVFGFCLLAAFTLATTSVDAANAATKTQDLQTQLGGIPEIDRPDDDVQEFFVAPSRGLSKAVLDTVYIYGGPGSLEGKFQTIDGGNGGSPDMQGWTGADLTEVPVFWNISDFNAGSFTGSVGNQALWSGVPAGTPGFLTAPGYGNSWDDRIVYTQAVNPAQAHSVRLAFQYHYDSEPGYDFFTVDYDSAGTWTNLLSVSGTNDDGSGTFPVPAEFDETIDFPLGALNGGDVRLRIRFISDSAASDEDPFFDSIAGACQVDNIRVFVDGGLSSLADFDGAAGDGDWVIDQAPFAGDFAKVFTGFQDLDPCASNFTPQMGFVDDGSPPSNSPVSTGGALSNNWAYGVAGSWVTNYTGGVTFGEVPINNQVWSPEIDWDLPGTDDDAAQGGAFLRVDLWEHLPLPNGMFWYWQVRSFPNAQNDWTGWRYRNLVTYEDLATYTNAQIAVGDLLVNNPQKVQIALGVIDLASVFGLPGGDATPAPFYDNVAFARFRVGGPAITSTNFQRLQDAFPQRGTLDTSDLASLAIRLDAPNEIVGNQGPNIVAADSTTIQVQAVLPGTTIDQPPVLKFVLDANPLFDGVRSLPAGASVIGQFTGRDGRQWNRWSGEILGEISINAAGAPVADYFFDFPDGPGRLVLGEADEPGMFYPGDVMRWFYEQTDSAGNVTTAPGGLTDPAQLARWEDGSWGIVGRGFTVRGLPSLLDPDGDGTPTQPSILMINDFGRRGGENDFITAFAQNGLFEGVDYDTYTVMDPDGGQGNGLGTAGSYGATVDQIRGYDTIFYDSGDLTLGLGDAVVDKSDDVGLLSQWDDLPGDRNVVYFGDYAASSLALGPGAAQAYLQTIMGVQVNSLVVLNDIAGQTTPLVVPTGAASSAFDTSFVAFGGCPGINQFDSIEPIAAAVRSHDFAAPGGGNGSYPASGGVWYERTVTAGSTNYRRVNVTFPFGMNVVWGAAANKAPNGSTAIGKLFEDLLTAFGKPINEPGATSATPAARSAMLGNTPNPFNPSTSIELRVAQQGRYSLRIYNVRGELVRTLLDAEMTTGSQSVVWDGRNADGMTVSSGVYLSKFVGPDVNDSAKLVLLK